jgi:proteasome lid subunit RPN8/RPN11
LTQLTSIQTRTIAAFEAAYSGLERAYREQLGTIAECVDNRQRHAASVHLQTAQILRESLNALEGARSTVNGVEAAPLYLCTSWFLKDCLLSLTKSKKEAMLFVAGLDVGNLRVLNRTLELSYSEQSEIYVAAEGESHRDALRQLEHHGLKLLSWFHSHPGSGEDSTQPSGIDLSHQRDLEMGGYSAVGAIVNRDGYVRFFSHSLCFDVVVLGKNIEVVGENLYRLREC